MAMVPITKDGPSMVDGDLQLVDQAGRPVKPRRAPYLLCRCGASVTKPFFDETHSKAMVFPTQETLIAAGADGNNVRSEEFSGY